MRNDNRQIDNYYDKVYRLLFENSKNAKLLVNSEGVIIKSNHSFLTMFGYNESEVLDQSISILIPKKYRKNHGKHIESYVKSPSKKIMEEVRKIEAQKKDNTLFPVEISLNYIEDDSEIIIVVSITDVIYSEIKKELAEKELVFGLATEAANIGAWSAIRDYNKPEGQLLESFNWFVNDQVNVQFGYPADLNISLSDFLKILHPDDYDMINSGLSDALNNVKEYDVVYRIIRPSGEIRYIESKGVVKFDENNRVNRMDGVTMDVTKKITTQDIIKKSAEKLTKFFEMAPNGIAKNDMDGNFLAINKEFERFTGYSKEELDNMSYWDLTPIEYKEEEALQVESLNKKGAYGPYEKEYIHKDGHRVPVLLNGVIIKDDYDGKNYIWSIVVDMTESLKVKKDLLEYERFFSLNEDMMAILSPKGKFLKLNSKVVRVLGYSEEYLKNIPFLNVFHADDKKNAINAFKEVFLGNIMINFKSRVVCQNGEVKWFMFSSILAKETGNVFSVAKDITEIEKTQRNVEELNKKLKESESKYRQLFENSTDSILLLKDGLFIDCNKAAIEMFECESKEYFVGSDPSVISAKTQENGKGSFEEAIKMIEIAVKNGTHSFEWIHKKKNGTLLPTEVVLTLVSKGIVHAVLRDITERKSAELRRAVYNNISQKLNSKVSVFEFCKFIEHELRKILSINSLYIMLYESENTHLSSIYIHDRFIKNHESVNRKNGGGLCEYVLKNKKGLKLSKSEYEKLILNKNIRQYRTAKFYWMGAPLMSESTPIGIITVDNCDGSIYSNEDLALLEFIGVQLGRLISRQENNYKLRLLNTTLEERVELRTFELSKAKDKISESLKIEQELSNLKSRFVSTASHQFRTPLTVIQTNLGILEIQKDQMSQGYQDKFDKISMRIKNQISKMTSMMDDLLTVGKINENGINFKPIKIDIISLCEKLIFNYDAIQEDGRFVEFKIKGRRKDVLLDPVLMEHVLSALISNAFKYSLDSLKKRNPILRINFQKDELEITVKDFGIGIPMEDVDHIHEPFFRASNVIDIAGTGLGMSIVKEYVEINNGEVSIKSKLNEYTEFKLVFKE